MNSCWTAGWQMQEVIGAIEQAFEESKAKFNHLVDAGQTVEAINDFFIKTVRSAMKPSLATRPKDEEQWVVRNRAHVSKHLKKGELRERRGGE